MIEDTIEFMDSLLRKAGLPSERCPDGTQIISKKGSRSVRVTRDADQFVVKIYEEPLSESIRTSYHEHPWQVSGAVDDWLMEERWRD